MCDIRPFKDDKHWIRLTVGGNKLEYISDASSIVDSLIKIKLLLNSVISEAKRGAQFTTLDLKDYLLQSDLPTPEYMKIHDFF